MAKAPTTKTTSPTAGASATAPVAPATTESSTVPSAPAEGESTNSTGAVDQSSESQPQQPQGEGSAEGVGANATAPVAPVTTESSTVPSAPPEGSTGAGQHGDYLLWVDEASGIEDSDVGASATTPAAPATTESSTVPVQTESLDLWVHNKGAFSKTEPRSKVLLGAGQTTHIQISSVAMRQTIERNIEQMNHLNGGRLLVLVDQPVAPEPEKDS